MMTLLLLLLADERQADSFFCGVVCFCACVCSLCWRQIETWAFENFLDAGDDFDG